MNTTSLLVKMNLDRWNASIKNCDVLLQDLTDEQLQREIAVGKNRGIYILGHLIAVHDDMLPLLNFGDRIFPELQEPFLKSADKVVKELPSVQDLKLKWKKTNTVLSEKIDGMHSDAWFEKHTAVSAEDFILEPHRNKLNIIITRTTHLAYHTGQLNLLK